jgi:hypothetical protein
MFPGRPVPDLARPPPFSRVGFFLFAETLRATRPSTVYRGSEKPVEAGKPANPRRRIYVG